jgi:hypothetical protein
LRIALAVTVSGSSTYLHARVVPAEFSTLFKKADVVVLCRVVGVDTIDGIRIARVRVIQTYKGRRLDVLSFVAQTTWTCDN